MKEKVLKVVLSVLAAAWMFCTVQTNVMAANDGALNATILTSGHAVSESLDAGTDVNYYKFDMTKQGYFTISFQTEALEGIGDGWKVSLLNANMENIGYYKVGTSLNSLPLPLKKGIYYITVEAYNNYISYAPIGVSYSLRVDAVESSTWECEDNNTSATATDISCEESYSGYLFLANDVDYYKVTTTKNGCFRVSINITDGQAPIGNTDGWRLTIYDKNLEEIKSYSYIKSGVTSAILPYGNGTFYIKVEAVYTSSAPKDTIYNLIVNEIETSTWEKEKNDTAQTANVIDIGVTYSGNLTSGSDVDYFKFTTSHAGSFSIDFGPAPGEDTSLVNDGWYLRLYDKNLDLINYYYGVKDQFTSDPVVYSAGTYYAQVQRANNAPIDLTYNITVNDPAKIGYYAAYDGCHFYKVGSGDTVCYREDGTQVFNEFKCDGTYTYFFQADGTAMKNRLSYHPDGVHVIYFDADGHEVFSNFANVKQTIAGDPVDDYCFFDVFGYLYVNVVTYDQSGKYLYYANPYGVLERGKWFQFAEGVMCADGTPWEGAAGNYGCANADGTLVKDRWTYDWEGRKCYMQGNGVALYQ